MHYNDDDSYSFANGKEIYKTKSDNKNVKFRTQFWLGSTSNKFDAIDFREGSLEEIANDFSVDDNSIDKSDVLCIHKYLMGKNNIQNVSTF